MPHEDIDMVDPDLWKFCVLEITNFYLRGVDIDEIRKVVKHLNILLNTELILQPHLTSAIAVLEALTFYINAIDAHHYCDDRLSGETRLNLIIAQLQSIRPRY